MIVGFFVITGTRSFRLLCASLSALFTDNSKIDNGEAEGFTIKLIA